MFWYITEEKDDLIFKYCCNTLGKRMRASMACECYRTTVALSSDGTHSRCHLTPESSRVTKLLLCDGDSGSISSTNLWLNSHQKLFISSNWSDRDIIPRLTCCSTWRRDVSLPDHLRSKSPKSSKSNRVICSRAACTEQRFLLPPWKYNSLKVATCACTRICCYMTACAPVSGCVHVCLCV